MHGAGVQPDGTVLVGGRINGVGSIARLQACGTKLAGTISLGTIVDEIAVDPTDGRFAAASDAGIAVYASNGAMLWSNNTLGSGGGGATESSGRRIAIAKDGHVVALYGHYATLFDASGNILKSIYVSSTAAEDIAIDSATAQIYATGYTQRDGGPCSQLQVPFIRAYGYDGSVKWNDYDATQYASASAGYCADGRGIRLAVAPDGSLVFTGHSAGGNSVFLSQPLDITQKAPIVSHDAYDTAYNTSSNNIGFTATYTSGGAINEGTFLITRFNSGKGNTVNPYAVAEDAQGNIYMGGAAAYQLANRSNQKIQHQTIGAYYGDGFLIVYGPNFSSRKVWTAWPADGPFTGGSIVYAIGVGAGRGVVAEGTKNSMILVAPLGTTHGSTSAAYYSVFPQIP